MAHNAVQPFPARRVDFHRGPRPDSKTATIVGCGANDRLTRQQRLPSLARSTNESISGVTHWTADAAREAFSFPRANGSES